MLTISMIIPPNSGDIPVGAFCVEQGRWSGRGQEKTAEFSASTARLPWKAARIALARRAQHEILPEAAQPGGGRLPPLPVVPPPGGKPLLHRVAQTVVVHAGPAVHRPKERQALVGRHLSVVLGKEPEPVLHLPAGDGV